MHKAYTLQFSTANDMNKFVQTLGSKYTEINVRTLRLVCECLEDDIARATKDYNASVIQAPQS